MEIDEASLISAAQIESDIEVIEQISQGLRDAKKHAEKKRRAQLPPALRDRLLNDSFPKVNPEEDQAKELTSYEFDELRGALRGVIRSDMKEKMVLLQNQLSEYHELLEHMSALTERCERLEREKRNLAIGCQVRDDKIALLEKDLAQFQRRNSILSVDETSVGASSPMHQGRRGDYDPPSFNETRRITLSPPIFPNLHGLDVGTIQPPPFFQKSSATLFPGGEMKRDTEFSQDRFAKRQRRSLV